MSEFFPDVPWSCDPMVKATQLSDDRATGVAHTSGSAIKAPPGTVFVDGPDGPELWFTNRVTPPANSGVDDVELVSTVPRLPSRRWADVERWRFRS